jgi:hypothetical protein
MRPRRCPELLPRATQPGQDAADRAMLDGPLCLLGPYLPVIASDTAWNVLAWNQAVTGHMTGNRTRGQARPT